MSIYGHLGRGAGVALVTREEASRWGLGSRCRLPNKAVGCQAERQGFGEGPFDPIIMAGIRGSGGCPHSAAELWPSQGHSIDLHEVKARTGGWVRAEAQQNQAKQGRVMSHGGNDHRQYGQGLRVCVWIWVRNGGLILSQAQEITSPINPITLISKAFAENPAVHNLLHFFFCLFSK